GGLRRQARAASPRASRAPARPAGGGHRHRRRARARRPARRHLLSAATARSGHARRRGGSVLPRRGVDGLHAALIHALRRAEGARTLAVMKTSRADEAIGWLADTGFWIKDGLSARPWLHVL